MFLQFGNFVSQLLIFLSKLTIFSSHLVWFVSDELQTEERKTRPLRSSTRGFSTIRSELFQTNGQCTILSLICLLQVTKIMMQSAQIILTICHIVMCRFQLFPTNGQCTIMTLFCLLQVTKATMHSAQILVTNCHIDMFRSELF